MGRVTRRDRGGLEKEVVAVLAAAGRPLTPSEVRAELGGGLARCGTSSPWSSTSPAWAPRGPLPGGGVDHGRGPAYHPGRAIEDNGGASPVALISRPPKRSISARTASFCSASNWAPPFRRPGQRLCRL